MSKTTLHNGIQASHPAELREPAPGEETPARAAEAPETTQAIGAESPSVRLVESAFDECIQSIQHNRTMFLEYYKRADRLVHESLADALLLKQILEDWENGSFANDFPDDARLVAAIRGNLDL